MTEPLSDVAAHYLRPGTLQLREQPPLSLYVHLPWCLKKCPYCDFNSHAVRAAPPAEHTLVRAAPQGGLPRETLKKSASGMKRKAHGAQRPRHIQQIGEGASTAQRCDSPAQPLIQRFPSASEANAAAAVPEARYVEALVADLDASLPLVWGRPIVSVFIGGGTPSLFSPEAIERLLSAIRARLPLIPDCEVTLEANPGTFERDRFAAYRAAGVTRLSIGVQSFDDAALQALGRVHDRAHAIAAVEEAARAFDTFNLDLMYALPQQTLAALDQDLATALAFAPPHLSVYHLTIEPNTYFAKHPPALPEDDLAYAMLDRITERTAAAGLERYEVSAYARRGHRCVHNQNYWQFGDYLGIGAGAHGKLSFPHRIVRQVRWREPERYMERALAGAPIAQAEEVARADLPFEFMLNALRLREGFDFARYTARTGLPLSSIEPQLSEAERRGWIERDLQGLRPTERGFDFLSDLQALFLP